MKIVIEIDIEDQILPISREDIKSGLEHGVCPSIIETMSDAFDLNVSTSVRLEGF